MSLYKKSSKSPRKKFVKKSLKFRPYDKFHMSENEIKSFRNKNQSSGTFPKGYFYTFGKKQCKEYNKSNEIGANFFYKFNTKNCNILVINTINKVKKFFLTYRGNNIDEINWEKVAERYDGVEFYDPLDYGGIYDKHMPRETTFYYSWKRFGLGFVWNIENLIIKEVKLPECIIDSESDSYSYSYESDYDSDSDSEYDDW